MPDVVEISWMQLAGLALGSSVLVKVLDIGYLEVNRWRERKKATKQFHDDQVVPLIKAADELFGKLHTLAEKDFKPIHGVVLDETCLHNREFASLVYLFGTFWARVEAVRAIQSSSSAANKDGKKLGQFFDCLESPKVRIVETIQQRAVGEMLVQDKGVKSYTAFVQAFEKEGDLRRWIEPLTKILSRVRHTTERQAVLQYATVLHVMIDEFDPQHAITSDRPSLARKLGAPTWQDLKYRVFGIYLKFVEEPQKYIGPPKARAAQSE